MSQQSLDQNEVLSIRWAHDDPNPVAQNAIDRANKDSMAQLLIAKGIFILFIFVKFVFIYLFILYRF
jgi:hypothetical protein